MLRLYQCEGTPQIRSKFPSKLKVMKSAQWTTGLTWTVFTPSCVSSKVIDLAYQPIQSRAVWPVEPVLDSQ